MITICGLSLPSSSVNLQLQGSSLLRLGGPNITGTAAERCSMHLIAKAHLRATYGEGSTIS